MFRLYIGDHRKLSAKKKKEKKKEHKSDVLTNFWKVGLAKGGEDLMVVSGLPRTL